MKMTTLDALSKLIGRARFDLMPFKSLSGMGRASCHIRLAVLICIIMLVYASLGYHQFMAVFATYLILSYVYAALLYLVPTQVRWPLFALVLTLSVTLNLTWLLGIIQLWTSDNTVLRFGAVVGLYSLMMNALSARRDMPLLSISDITAACVGAVSFPWASYFILANPTEALIVGAASVLSFTVFLGRLGAISSDINQAIADQLEAVTLEKMTAIGRLTGGVAHDFNNILTVISGNLELIKETNDPALRAKLIQEANAASKRAAEVTNQLLVFSRQAVLSPRPLQPDNAIEKVALVVQHMVPDSIVFSAEIQEGLPEFVVDVGQFETVVAALCLNARDAMPGGGRLDLLVARLVVPNRGGAGAAAKLQAGAYVHVCVADTGIGIGKDEIDRVCEPYYSTKGLGKGSGLGLAMVKGFTEQSGGTLHIASAIGIGTRVSLFFPSLED